MASLAALRHVGESASCVARITPLLQQLSLLAVDSAHRKPGKIVLLPLRRISCRNVTNFVAMGVVRSGVVNAIL